MSDTKTVVIPSLSLNYENNLLESIGVGGELYHREQHDWRAIARSHEQTIKRMGTENAKLRELVCHLYYVKPRDVTSILVNGEVLNFDELMAEVGLRWEDA